MSWGKMKIQFLSPDYPGDIFLIGKGQMVQNRVRIQNFCEAIFT